MFWTTVMAAIDKNHVTHVMMLWQRVEDGNGGKTEEEAGSAWLDSQPQLENGILKTQYLTKKLAVREM